MGWSSEHVSVRVPLLEYVQLPQPVFSSTTTAHICLRPPLPTYSAELQFSLRLAGPWRLIQKHPLKCSTVIAILSVVLGWGSAACVGLLLVSSRFLESDAGGDQGEQEDTGGTLDEAKEAGGTPQADKKKDLNRGLPHEPLTTVNSIAAFLNRGLSQSPPTAVPAAKAQAAKAQASASPAVAAPAKAKAFAGARGAGMAGLLFTGVRRRLP